MVVRTFSVSLHQEHCYEADNAKLFAFEKEAAILCRLRRPQSFSSLPPAPPQIFAVYLPDFARLSIQSWLFDLFNIRGG